MVPFETILLCQVSQALVTQEEALAHFPVALRELLQAFHHAHHAVAKMPETRRMVVCLMMANQNVLTARTTVSPLFLALEILVFSDQGTRLFVDQGTGKGLAKHCLASIVEVADDRRDMEERESDNDRIQKCQQCADYYLMELGKQWKLSYVSSMVRQWAICALFVYSRTSRPPLSGLKRRS